MNLALSCLMLLSSFCFISITEACSCVPLSMRHRNVGCKDEFMAIVNITGVAHKDSELRNEYSFTIIDDRTPSLSKHDNLNRFNNTIISNDNPGTCGVDLEVNSIYLLKGTLSSVPSIWLCSSVWRKLPQAPSPSESKAMLDAFYAEQC